MIIVASILLGLAAAGALFWVQRASARVVPALVAARDISARQVLRQEDLRVVMVPPAVRDSQAIQDPTKLVGRLLVSPVFAGEQIRPGRIDENERDLVVDEVAIGFPTDLTKGVGGLLEAGDVVDIYWSPGSDAKVVGLIEPMKIGEGFRVLSVRDGAGRATGPRVNSDPTRSQGTAGLPAVVVLKVPANQTPDIGVKLLQASEKGILTFAKRAANTPVPEQPILTPIPDDILKIDINGNLNGLLNGATQGNPAGTPPNGQVRP